MEQGLRDLPRLPQHRFPQGRGFPEKFQVMFFRFTSAIVLVVLVSMAGVVLEKRMLDLRRDVSKQQYRTEILLDQYSALRLRTQQLSAPDRMLEAMRDQKLTPRPLTRREQPAAAAKPPGNTAGKDDLAAEAPAKANPKQLPLLNWERPVRPFRWRQKDIAP